MKVLAWPLAPLIIIVLAIALFAAPTRFEGPILLPISPGHALSVLDSFALLPLLICVVWLYGGLWQRRQRLGDFMRQSPTVNRGSEIPIHRSGFANMVESAFS